MNGLTVNDIDVGSECPACGKVITVWRAHNVTDEENVGEEFEDDWCWLWSEEFEETEFGRRPAGNVVMIGHDPPKMEHD